jgi:hypothetical protein
MDIVHIDKCWYEIQKQKGSSGTVHWHIPAHFEHVYGCGERVASCAHPSHTQPPVLLCMASYIWLHYAQNLWIRLGLYGSLRVHSGVVEPDQLQQTGLWRGTTAGTTARQQQSGPPFDTAYSQLVIGELRVRWRRMHSSLRHLQALLWLLSEEWHDTCKPSKFWQGEKTSSSCGHCGATPLISYFQTSTAERQSCCYVGISTGPSFYLRVQQLCVKEN